MKRVFTDDRFPGIQIVNEGGNTFEIWLNGKLDTTFESWENSDGTVTEAFAGRRAEDYFDRLSRTDLSEILEQELEGDRDHTEVFNAPIQKPSASQIDTLMAKERLELDPAKKAELRQHILNLMRQEETLAESVVNHLLEM